MGVLTLLTMPSLELVDRLVLAGVAIGAVGTLALTHIWNKCPQPAAEPKPCEQEESAAEAELVTARDLAEQALKSSPDEQITGLIIGGQPGNPLHFSVQGSNASQYNNALAAGEKPLVLTYFAIQGLGEVPRLMLAEAGAAYSHLAMVGNEHAAAAAEWRKRSANGLLPVMSGLGVPRSTPLCQSSSIIRFLAARYGMQGSGQTAKNAADVLFETAKDLHKHQADVVAMGAKEVEGNAKGPWALAIRLESMIAAAPSVADPDAALTYGQLQLLHCLMMMEELKPGCVEHLSSKLEQFRAAAIQRSRIAKYLSSAVRFPSQDAQYNYKSGPIARKHLTC